LIVALMIQNATEWQDVHFLMIKILKLS